MVETLFELINEIETKTKQEKEFGLVSLNNDVKMIKCFGKDVSGDYFTVPELDK